MKTKDFENAIRVGMRFDAFFFEKGSREVLSVKGCVTGDDGEELQAVWDARGRSYLFLLQEEDYRVLCPNKNCPPYAIWNGRALARSPFFDLKID